MKKIKSSFFAIIMLSILMSQVAFAKREGGATSSGTNDGALSSICYEEFENSSQAYADRFLLKSCLIEKGQMSVLLARCISESENPREYSYFCMDQHID